MGRYGEKADLEESDLYPVEDLTAVLDSKCHLNQVWWRKVTDQNGFRFYYNVKTGEASDHRPPGGNLRHFGIQGKYYHGRRPASTIDYHVTFSNNF